MQKAERRLQAILKRAESSDIKQEIISELEIVKKLCNNRKTYKKRSCILIAILSILIYLLYPLKTDEVSAGSYKFVSLFILLLSSLS